MTSHALQSDQTAAVTPATVFILDFGAQYSQLIARRTREANVYCEIVPHDTPWSVLAAREPAAIILSGGPESTLVPGAPGMDPQILRSGVPVLGICYGMQLVARDLGAKLVKLDHAEYGPATLSVTGKTPLFNGVAERSRVWMSHGDSVVQLPPGFRPVAQTERCNVAAMANEERKIYCVQFHPEVVHTQFGKQLIDNFLHGIAGISSEWKMENFVDRAIADIR
jgi:GMP synthase (glutamine-hydrolysing)